MTDRATNPSWAPLLCALLSCTAQPWTSGVSHREAGDRVWPGLAEPPATRREVVVDRLHGVDVADPYRWLEDLESEAVVDWTRAQDRRTRALLTSLPGRQAIRRRAEAIAALERSFPPQRRGDLSVWARVAREGEGRRWRLYARRSEWPEARVLVDAGDRGEEARFATYPGTGSPAFDLSPDGRLLAFGISQGASRWSEWRVLEIDTGRELPARLVGVHQSAPLVRWSADSRSLIYAAYEPPPAADSLDQGALRDHRILRHRLGSAGAGDEVLLARPERPETAFWFWLSSDRRTLVAQGSEGGESDLSARRLDPDSAAVALVPASPHVHTVAGGVGSTLWLRTTVGAPRGRLVAVDLSRPQRPWREIVPEDPGATLTAAAFRGGRFLLQYTRDALPELVLVEATGERVREVELPYHGWIRSGFVGTGDDPRVTFVLQGTGEPDTVYELDMRTGASRVLLAAEPAFDRDAYRSRQVFVRSADGARIPMTLMHRRDLNLERSGTDAPAAWLYAYGANWAAVPWYSHRFRLWLEMGGVYALANIRGGSEYGEDWRLAGSGVNKQRGVDDYLAAAQWLVDNGYASPETLVANGGSASGPVAAAALLQRPESFGAAAIDYPVLDLLRYHLFAAGATAGNWGTAEDPDELRALLRWSPQQNVRGGVCYPPTLLSQGDQDRAASPLHSYKFAAALQHAQGCASPVLLQVAWGHGHTVGGLDEIANQLAFLAAATGLEVPADW